MRSIAVLTSGGDAPGMNAAIRSVVRTGIAKGWEVYGVRDGYRGLMDGAFVPLGMRDVGGIIQQAGTILGSARAPEFKSEEGQEKALAELRERQIDALVVIGGNGSQTGANALHEKGFPVVGIASTIDNDLYGSDITIGVDTALNVALEAIDRLRVTAASHRRAFFVEVMGRDSGYLALMSAIAGGAELAVIPERPTTPEQVAEEIRQAYQRGKNHGIIVVAEGAYDAEELARLCTERYAGLGFEVRAVTLGHVQRGGEPSAFDRVLGSRFGGEATRALERGEPGVLVGLRGNGVVTTPYREVMAHKKTVDPQLIELAYELSR